MKTMRRKRSLTLLEIMIVIFLIGLIGTVIGANMKGSMEEGKAFKTKQAMQQLEDILTMQLAEGEVTVEDIKENPVGCLKKSNLVKSPESIVKDGWNNPFTISVDNDQVKVYSAKYAGYLKKKETAMKKEGEKKEGDAA